MPRFVILEHDHPQLHWDLMLETGAVLRTWRLAAPPHGAATVAATAIGDHRLHYLDYEGPVSGGRGCVQRWDAGSYVVEVADEGQLVLILQGGRLRGRALLRRREGVEWLMSFDPAKESS